MSIGPTIVDELREITPPNSELLELADRHPAPQAWYDEPALDVPPRRSEQVTVTIKQGGYRPPEINVED